MASRPRWYELLPELVLATGLAVFLVDEPDAATSAFKSGRAVGMMAAAAVAWVIARVVLFRLVPWRLVRTALFGIAAVAALAVVVLPAYDDETVVEAFPIPSSTAVVVSTPSTTPVASTTPTTRSEVDRRATATSAPAIPTTTTTTMAAAPSGPVRLRTGAFMGIDHRAVGTVSIYRAPDGMHVVGLEEFDIQPGPDYDVYVVPGTERNDPDGGTRLDDLRGNQGTQYYEVPAEVDVAAGAWTVLIWCQTFGVPVANATPQ